MDSDQNIISQSDNSKLLPMKRQKNLDNDEQSRIKELQLDFDLIGIGTIESIFNKKNGTPRQSGICPQSKGVIRLNKRLFNNPIHALEGIEQFQYVWILYYFHQNNNKRRFIAKVRPPRLNGASCGVYASRAPHRPNPIGLTLAKIENITKDGLLHVSGIDIVDGTPIVDIKPYIEKYDYPFHGEAIPQAPNPQICDQVEDRQATDSADQTVDPEHCVPKDWVNGSIVSDISVDFTSRSLMQLSKFHCRSSHTDCSVRCDYCFRLFQSEDEAKQAIINLLQADPRSVYRRNKCLDRLYYFTIDSVHITAWFDVDNHLVEVVKIKPYVSE